MPTLQVVFYILALILLILAGIPPMKLFRYSLCCFAAASALFAFALPTIAGGIQ